MMSHGAQGLGAVGVLAVVMVFGMSVVTVQRAVGGESGLGIAVGPRGYVYTVGENNREVWVLDPSGMRVRTIRFERFHQLGGMLVQPSGALMITDAKAGRIYVILPTPEGEFPPVDYLVREISSPLLRRPIGLVDLSRGTAVGVVDGGEIASFLVMREGGIAVKGDAFHWKGFEDPRGVVSDETGNVYISSPTAIYKLEPKGAKPREVASLGNGDFQGIALDSVGNLLVADAKNGVVWALDPGERSKSTWRKVVGFKAPSGVTSDPSGTVYLRDGSGAIYRVGASEKEGWPIRVGTRVFDPERVDQPQRGDFREDPEVVLLARLVFGEARRYQDENKALLSRRGMAAIGWSVANRTGRNRPWGNTIHGVLLNPNAYPAFSPTSRYFEDVRNPAERARALWRECLTVAEEIVTKGGNDPTEGATHYSWEAARKSWVQMAPELAALLKPVAEYDGVMFYRLPEGESSPTKK